MPNEIIGSDAPLTPPQRSTLRLLLDLIVPASPDRRLPSAADIDVLVDVDRSAPDLLPTLRAELDRLNHESVARFAVSFAELADTARKRLVDAMRSDDPAFLRVLAVQTVTRYYQDDRVLTAIGLEPRPPFPQGYSVKSGDLSLLDPVRERGQVWREVPND